MKWMEESPEYLGGNFKQCKLVGPNDTRFDAWVPESIAIRGNKVKVKRGDEWESGWIIYQVAHLTVFTGEELGIQCGVYEDNVSGEMVVDPK